MRLEVLVVVSWAGVDMGVTFTPHLSDRSFGVGVGVASVGFHSCNISEQA